MKQFLAFVKKEFYHIFRDKRTMFILLGMPIMQIIIFGFALTNEVKDSRIAILDNAKDQSSTDLINEIEASQYFNIEEYLHTYSDVEKTFKRGTIKMVVVFPAPFGPRIPKISSLLMESEMPFTASCGASL